MFPTTFWPWTKRTEHLFEAIIKIKEIKLHGVETTMEKSLWCLKRIRTKTSEDSVIKCYCDPGDSVKCQGGVTTNQIKFIIAFAVWWLYMVENEHLQRWEPSWKWKKSMVVADSVDVFLIWGTTVSAVRGSSALRGDCTGCLVGGNLSAINHTLTQTGCSHSLTESFQIADIWVKSSPFIYKLVKK